MKDFIKVAQDLSTYFNTRRTVGHTNSAYKGNDDSIYIVTDNNAKNELRQKYGNGRKILTVDSIESGALVAENKPIVIDHFVFQVLIDGLLDEIHKANSERG